MMKIHVVVDAVAVVVDAVVVKVKKRPQVQMN